MRMSHDDAATLRAAPLHPPGPHLLSRMLVRGNELILMLAALRLFLDATIAQDTL